MVIIIMSKKKEEKISLQKYISKEANKENINKRWHPEDDNDQKEKLRREILENQQFLNDVCR